MATAADACANIQTETERETAMATTTKTSKLKIKETGAEKTTAMENGETEEEEEEEDVDNEAELKMDEEEEEEDIERGEEVSDENEEDEDVEVLYDSLELPQIPAVKTSAVAAFEQKLTKAAASTSTANQLKGGAVVRVEILQEAQVTTTKMPFEEIASSAVTIANGANVAEAIKLEEIEKQDVVDFSCIKQKHQQQQQQLYENDFSTVDDIPEPIKVLDDIISEFETSSDVKPAIGSVENQSEDDGYMSLSRKK